MTESKGAHVCISALNSLSPMYDGVEMRIHDRLFSIKLSPPNSCSDEDQDLCFDNDNDKHINIPAYNNYRHPSQSSQSSQPKNMSEVATVVSDIIPQRSPSEHFSDGLYALSNVTLQSIPSNTGNIIIDLDTCEDSIIEDISRIDMDAPPRLISSPIGISTFEDYEYFDCFLYEKGIYRLGDNVFVKSSNPRKPFIAKISQIQKEIGCDIPTIALQWYFRIEETGIDRSHKKFISMREIFLSDSPPDINSIDTIVGRPTVLSPVEYESLLNNEKGSDVFFCSRLYNPVNKSIRNISPLLGVDNFESSDGDWMDLDDDCTMEVEANVMNYSNTNIDEPCTYQKYMSYFRSSEEYPFRYPSLGNRYQAIVPPTVYGSRAFAALYSPSNQFQNGMSLGCPSCETYKEGINVWNPLTCKINNEIVNDYLIYCKTWFCSKFRRHRFGRKNCFVNDASDLTKLKDGAWRNDVLAVTAILSADRLCGYPCLSTCMDLRHLCITEDVLLNYLQFNNFDIGKVIKSFHHLYDDPWDIWSDDEIDIFTLNIQSTRGELNIQNMTELISTGKKTPRDIINFYYRGYINQIILLCGDEKDEMKINGTSEKTLVRISIDDSSSSEGNYSFADEAEESVYCSLCPVRSIDCISLEPSRSFDLFRATGDIWVHRICATLLPELKFININGRERVVGIKNIDQERWRLMCFICRRRGLGACVQCTKGRCATAFHPSCAVIGKLEADETTTQFYCLKHRPSIPQILEKK